MKHLIFLLILISSMQAEAFVKDPIYDDLEDQDLAGALIRDGKLQQALAELQGSGMRRQNPSRYHMLLGQFHYAKEEWPKAIREFRNSLGAKQVTHKDEARLFLSRTLFQAKKYKDCADEFQELGYEKLAHETDFIWRAQCEYQSKKIPRSWHTLRLAEKRFPGFATLREVMGLQIELGLGHEALEKALAWLHTHPALPTQYLNLSEIFHTHGYLEFALYMLEAGRVRYPMHADINLALSQLYFQKQMLLASEEGFVRAAASEPKYYYHAAELNRQLGRYERAQYYNAFVSDPKEKLKQKIATYVDTGKFPLIASLDSVIQRSELAEDDEIRYALAYSLVRLGKIDEPLQYLSSIKRTDLLEKTTVLRKALLDCQEKKSLCKI